MHAGPPIVLSLVLVLSLVPAPSIPADERAASVRELSPAQIDLYERVACEPGAKGRGHRIVQRGGSIGVLIDPTAFVLSRIEFELKHGDDPHMVQIRLWRWKGDRPSTRHSAAVYEDAISLGRGGWRSYSVYPRIVVDPGESYYVELRAPPLGAFAVRTASSTSEAHPEGCLSRPKSSVRSGHIAQGEPMWLRLYSLPALAGSPSDDDVVSKGEGPRSPGRPPETDPQATQSGSDTQVGMGPAWLPPLDLGPVAGVRQHYIGRVERFADGEFDRVFRGCGIESHRIAFLYAFLYEASCDMSRCDEAHARRAQTLLERAAALTRCDLDALGRSADSACRLACGVDTGPMDFARLIEPTWAYAWIRGSVAAAEGDREAVRRMLLEQAQSYWPERWRGSFNRSTVAAAGYAAMADVFERETAAAEWRMYADQVFRDVVEAFETEEDSASYSAESWLPGVLLLAESLGREDELWGAPGFRALVDRFADYMAPAGVLPGFGDGSGYAYDSPGLIWLFEEAGRRYRDGRYRWHAERILEYNRTRAVHARPRSESWGRFMDHVARAWLAADESVTPTPPSVLPSTITWRRAIEILPRRNWGQPKRFARFRDDDVPDKLVLRSGGGSGGLFAMFNLLSGYRHGHPNLGALVLLMDEGSVLVSETAYPYARHQADPRNENISYVERLWGGSPGDAGTSVEVELFENEPDVTVAWLSWLDEEGWGIRQHRHIYFLKHRAIWVQDRFEVPEGVAAALNVQWYAAAIASERGRDWVTAYQPAPYRNVWRHRNPERYAVVYSSSTGDGRLEVSNRREFGPTPDCDPSALLDSPTTAECRRSPSILLKRQEYVVGGNGASPEFATIIVPTDAPVSGLSTDSGVDLVVDVEEGGPARATISIGDERWVLVDNPDGARFGVLGEWSNARWRAVKLQSAGR